eukprot:CAMPEP_0184663240 /NCGR_PEP_ID=MMETSP0308-20130426/47202_1 /TAXON_ID=38269 /ORGANISM="Gloeochaete witrockiana, Strain SAG 46.84" /LENGTH=41 /DNA_ID= /DNA_START= /DNA_END= /DNA_ORIENTATION=
MANQWFDREEEKGGDERRGEETKDGGGEGAHLDAVLVPGTA